MEGQMDFGAAMFFTDYSMTPADLGKALEARGFESVWAPEHSHIPSTRKTPPAGGGELEKRYYDVMDPFVTLTAAAMGTKTLKVGTGVLSGQPARHDPDRETRRFYRSHLGRAVPIRRRRRLEPRRNREPRDGVQKPIQKNARTDRGDEGDLDKIR